MNLTYWCIIIDAGLSREEDEAEGERQDAHVALVEPAREEGRVAEEPRDAREPQEPREPCDAPEPRRGRLDRAAPPHVWH